VVKEQQYISQGQTFIASLQPLHSLLSNSSRPYRTPSV